MFFGSRIVERALFRRLHGFIVSVLVLHGAGVAPLQGVAARAVASAIEAQHEIEQALDADDVYNRIEALKPTHPLYINLKRKVVLLTYWTAWVDPQRSVNFRRDIYGQDEAWAKGLAGQFA